MSTPLRELINRLADDSSSQAAFAADPAGFLAEHGWADLDGQDVGTALGALADEAPIEQAVRLGEVEAEDAIAGLGAAAAVFADVPANGQDPDLTLDRQDDSDPSSSIDEIDGIDDGMDDGPDGPDGLDVSDEDLDGAFRGDHEDRGDGEEAAEPTVEGEPEPDISDDHDIPLGDPTGGIDEIDEIDEGVGHESFVDTDDGGDAVDLPEPDDDDL